MRQSSKNVGWQTEMLILGLGLKAKFLGLGIRLGILWPWP